MKQESKDEKRVSYGDCGAEHDACTESPNGHCNKETGHDGSHHCDKCRRMF